MTQAHPTNWGTRAVLDGTQPQDVKDLIDVFDPVGIDSDQAKRQPGSWVLSVQSSVTASGLPNEVNAALLQVTFGSGGQALTVECSIFPDAVIVLPSVRCSAKVKWDRLPAPPPVGGGYSLPTAVEVRATLTRSFGAVARMRRLAWLPLSLTTGTPELANLPIPRFAKSLRTYADDLTHPAFSSDLVWSFLPGGWTQSGLALGRLTADGQEYELGGGVTGVSGNGLVANWGGSPFAVPSVWALDWGIEI